MYKKYLLAVFFVGLFHRKSSAHQHDVKELNTSKELEDFQADPEKEACAVGYFKDNDIALKGEFLKASDRLTHKIRFGYTTRIQDKHGIFLFRHVFLKNKFEDNQVEYTGAGTSDGIVDFIEKHYRGLVGYRKRSNLFDFETPLVTVYYNMDYKRDRKGTNYWRNRVLKVAREFKDKLNFAVSSSVEFGSEIEDMGLEDRQLPLVVARDAKNEKYILEVNFSMDALGEFAKKFLENRLLAYSKSQPIPEENHGPVKVAVARNFDDVVRDSKIDALVEFYAPWCGHCQKLAPIYEKLATAMKDEDVLIVKMDATANDIPRGFEVTGFPTIYWVAGGAHRPVRYNGAHDLEALIKFVAGRAKEELRGYDRSGKRKKPPSAKEKVEL